MAAFFKLTERVRSNQTIAENLVTATFQEPLSVTQLGALSAALQLRRSLFPCPDLVHAKLGTLHRTQAADFAEIPVEYDALSLPMSCGGWPNFAKAVADNTISDGSLGRWLMTVTLSGLCDSDTAALTIAMRKSGREFDYRPHFPKDRLVRRYPTGALSEKIALVMPTVLVWLRATLGLPVISPFIVARVMGHTGGTWDKLAGAFPDIQLPSQGEDALQILQKCGVSYVVTQDDFNPADRRMYRLRSETDTIESLPLIIASIASKMTACPVHRMQLDVRAGTGAFFKTHMEAVRAGDAIAQACTIDDMICYPTVTPAHFPTGSSVGSRVEVAEAIEVLGGESTGLFDPRGIIEQRFITADFVSRLVAEEFHLAQADLFRQVFQGFETGVYQPCFETLLRLHGIAPVECTTVWLDPAKLFRDIPSHDVRASSHGRLRSIDQVTLGRYVNEPGKKRDVILGVRPHDSVVEGQLLARIYGDFSLDERPSLGIFYLA